MVDLNPQRRIALVIIGKSETGAASTVAIGELSLEHGQGA